ncbi:uncharacterized protein E5676_scaffold313G002390 [Cucumis melo var. makuwa]|uniref:Uncharacterized protein n=1 Tax=Cucumis melo var. makuwa TaxID=1194695 RepID=A0A5A7V2R6_CUCMM|nr:uncharacterized protein E6C27_scaffold154G001480 [Cucumis melo var. makuwa]TYK26606.1 uncharacterized protein E5676_scaffold313G002390 [Cucumis melo var. makuwa]
MELSVLSVSAELSATKELLMALVKGKVIDSQLYYDDGEGTSFNAPKPQIFISDAFMDVLALNIDAQLDDKGRRTSIVTTPGRVSYLSTYHWRVRMYHYGFSTHARAKRQVHRV